MVSAHLCRMIIYMKITGDNNSSAAVQGEHKFILSARWFFMNHFKTCFSARPVEYLLSDRHGRELMQLQFPACGYFFLLNMKY